MSVYGEVKIGNFDQYNVSKEGPFVYFMSNGIIQEGRIRSGQYCGIIKDINPTGRVIERKYSDC